MRLGYFRTFGAAIITTVSAISTAMSQQPSSFADKLASDRDRAAYESLRIRFFALAGDQTADVGSIFDEIAKQVGKVVATIPVITGEQPTPNSVCSDLLGRWHAPDGFVLVDELGRKYMQPRQLFRHVISVGCMTAVKGQIEKNRAGTIVEVAKWVSARLNEDGSFQTTRKGGLPRPRTAMGACDHVDTWQFWYKNSDRFHDGKATFTGCAVALQPAFDKIAAREKQALDAHAGDITKKLAAELKAAAELDRLDHWCRKLVAGALGAQAGMPPTDQRLSLIATCERDGASIFQSEIDARIDVAVAKVRKLGTSPEAFAKAGVLMVPNLGLASLDDQGRASRRYNAAVGPMEQVVAAEVSARIDRVYDGASAPRKAKPALAALCSKAWGRDTSTSMEIAGKCKSQLAAVNKAICSTAVEKVNSKKLGHSDTILAQVDERLSPIDFNLVVCASAIDGFDVAVKSSWIPFSPTTITIANYEGVRNEVEIRLEKSSFRGKSVWKATEFVKDRPPFDEIYDVLSCFQTTVEENSWAVLLKGMGYMGAREFGIDAEDFGLNFFAGVFDHAKCVTYKDTWRNNQIMKSTSESIVEFFNGLGKP